jgi:hypothetical protein
MGASVPAACELALGGDVAGGFFTRASMVIE